MDIKERVKSRIIREKNKFEKEKKIFGKDYSNYLQYNLIKETRSLKEATWFMVILIGVTLVYYLFSYNQENIVIDLLKTLTIIFSISLLLFIIFSIAVGIIKKIKEKIGIQ